MHSAHEKVLQDNSGGISLLTEIDVWSFLRMLAKNCSAYYIAEKAVPSNKAILSALWKRRHPAKWYWLIG